MEGKSSRSGIFANLKKLKDSDSNDFEQFVTIIICIIIIFSFMVCEIVIGYWKAAQTLVADSMHMMSDLLSHIFSVYLIYKSATQTDPNLTFGNVRYKPLSGLICSVFLVATMTGMFIEGIVSVVIGDSHHSEKTIYDKKIVLLTSSLGLVANILSFIILNSGLPCFDKKKEDNHDHSHSHTDETGNVQSHSHTGHSHSHSGNCGHSDNADSHCEDSPSSSSSDDKDKAKNTNTEKKVESNMRALILHIAGDTLGSLAAIINALVVIYAKGDGVAYCDPIFCIVISLFIGGLGLKEVYGAFSIFLEKSPCQVKELEKSISETGDILNIKVWAWELKEGTTIGFVKCKYDGNEQANKEKQIKEAMKDNNVDCYSVSFINDEELDDTDTSKSFLYY